MQRLCPLTCSHCVVHVLVREGDEVAPVTPEVVDLDPEAQGHLAEVILKVTVVGHPGLGGEEAVGLEGGHRNAWFRGEMIFDD